MIIVQVFLTVKESAIEDFIRFTNDNVANSVKEPGVKRFEFFRDLDADNKFILFEMFKSAEEQNKHRETAHYKRWKENTAEMLEVPSTRSSLEYVEMEME
ncbi:MAG TPA: putative quinol monooxygenase [Spirochaetota bacterium]|nr:putative quinol monooxygenase [Spirochaetota bacterium]HPS85676.1 putative quinol monooxygenase [Spirochaetota bacterium]